MRFAIHSSAGSPLFVKVGALPWDRQPYLAFASAAVAEKFCGVAAISNATVLPFDGAHAYEKDRGIVLFRTEQEVETYGATPTEFPLLDLIVPFEGA